MYQSKRGGGSGGWKGGKSFGNKKTWERNSGGQDFKSVMHPATCNDCGRRCEVPFKPNGRKPVLCKNCFSQGNDFAPKFASRHDSGRSAGEDDTATQLRAINAKLDAILQVLKSDDLSLS